MKPLISLLVLTGRVYPSMSRRNLLSPSPKIAMSRPKRLRVGYPKNWNKNLYMLVTSNIYNII